MSSQAFINTENDPTCPAPGVSGAGLTDADERVLVAAAQEGNSEAFGILVDRYYRKVFGLVYKTSGSDEAEDLTQEVFLKALKALRSFQFQGEAAFRTWLYRIAINSSINELRKRRRRRNREGPSLDERVDTGSGELVRDVPDGEDTPLEALEREQTRQAVWQALESLRPKYRQAIVLVDMEGLEYREAALIVRCPLGTLKSRVARAREAFAVQYGRIFRKP